VAISGRKSSAIDRDRLYYLDRVEHYRKRYWFKIYAYVLMSNHVHLLLETSKTPLSKIHSSRSQVSKELRIQLFAMLVQNGL
jgi:REP element-mobilizing transposase RayT